MKTPLFIAFLFFVGLLTAQSATVSKLAAMYPDDEVRSELNLSGTWLKMLTKNKDENRASDGHLSGVHILSVPRPDRMKLNQLSQSLQAEGYELLTSFRSNGDQGYILIKENAKGITELIATFNGEEDKITTISVTGLFTFDDLDNVDIDIDGWDNVKRGR